MPGTTGTRNPLGVTASGMQRMLPLAALALSAAVSADPFDGVRREIESISAVENLPSMVVVVARKGEVIWEQSEGWADREAKIPATPDTLYALASISKPMTATAIMVLAEQGKLNVDSPVNQYLGQHKLRARVSDANLATIRLVASHTSGLPAYDAYFYDGQPAPSMEQIIERYGQIMYPPGKSYVYSNLGFGVLGYVIERVSGKPYAEFMTQEIFEPLGMRHSAIGPLPSTPSRRVAVGYCAAGRVPYFTMTDEGAGSIWSSARDLLRFGMFHLKEPLPDQAPIISRRNVAEMMVGTAHDPGDANGKGARGFGWGIHVISGIRVVSHGGSMPGGASRLTLLPDQDIAIVSLTNALTRSLGRIESAVMRALLPEVVRYEDTFKAPAALMGRWEGRIETHTGAVPLRLDVTAPGHIVARIGNAKPIEVFEKQLLESGELLLSEVEGSVGTPDAERYPYRLQFTLTPKEKSLRGVVLADPRALRDRMGSLLPYWVEMRNVGSVPSD